MSRFDPRSHSTVVMTVKDQNTGVAEFPIKTYVAGSNIHKSTLSPVDARGKFHPSASAAELNTTVIETNKGTRRLSPVALAHSYLDQSPIITEGAVEQGGDFQRGPVTVRLEPNQTLTNTAARGYASLLPTANALTNEDISRVRNDELGKQVVAGSPQSRLISGRWRHCANPVEGDPVYTDYYGPLGGGSQQSSYYGRSYHLGDMRSGLRSNKLVEDSAYSKVQASMQGIHSLRSRPGLAIESKIIHSHSTDAPTTKATHTLTAYHRVHA